MSSAHTDEVRRLAEVIELSDEMKHEVACLALRLGEPPDEILAEALSELRTLRNVLCQDDECPTTKICWRPLGKDEAAAQRHRDGPCTTH